MARDARAVSAARGRANDLFLSAERPFLRTSDIVIVRYYKRQASKKIRIEASHNLITLLVNGRKYVFGLDGKLSIAEGEGFFLKRGNCLMNEHCVRDQCYESMLFFFSDRIAQQLTTNMATDAFKVDLAKKSFTILPVSSLKGPNGLTIINDKKTVYCVGFGIDNKPNGEVVKIDVASLKSE